MNDFSNLEKVIVRELSCRLCLCTDVVKLKPLSAEVKRKIKRLFDIVVRTDDSLPKAICHDCLQQVSALHLYIIKVDKTQKFLEFHKFKNQGTNREAAPGETKLCQMTAPVSPTSDKPKTPNVQGDLKENKPKSHSTKKKSAAELKLMESLTLDEFAKAEKVDKNLLSPTDHIRQRSPRLKSTITKPASPSSPLRRSKDDHQEAMTSVLSSETLDPVVLIDGRPAKQGAALDKQISLFYKMECCICHEQGFHFRSLMRHYKDRHGVPGYVTCCNKKFHYFHPKKIIEHMAYHLQPNIFMCSSCHQNFQTSQELTEHQSNGGKSEGKIQCLKCSERFPTYRELGCHLISHRTDKNQCDYCGKILKHHHRKKTINSMEDVILCSTCTRSLKNIENQEREIKEKIKLKNDPAVLQKHQKFKQAMGLSSDEDGSTD